MSNDSTRKQRDGSVSTQILSFLVSHANEIVLADEIVRATGLTKTQVQKSLSGFLTKEPRIRTVIGGNAWTYDRDPILTEAAPAPEVAPAKIASTSARIYEEVGATREGRVIVRDENGTLFVLGDI